MNPCNAVSLYGTVESVQIIKNREDKEFAVRFRLKVKRAYRGSDGNYGHDLITVKYELDDAGRGKIARSIAPNDGLHVIGSIRVDEYKGNFLTYVFADAISLDENTRSRKFGGEKIVTMSEDLPY